MRTATEIFEGSQRLIDASSQQTPKIEVFPGASRRNVLIGSTARPNKRNPRPENVQTIVPQLVRQRDGSGTRRIAGGARAPAANHRYIGHTNTCREKCEKFKETTRILNGRRRDSASGSGYEDMLGAKTCDRFRPIIRGAAPSTIVTKVPPPGRGSSDPGAFIPVSSS